MILSIDEYLSKYDYKYHSYVRSFVRERDDSLERSRLITSGMIKWDDEEACSWGGPFPGNFALFTIRDYTNGMIGQRSLESEQEIRDSVIAYEMTSQFNYPARYHDDKCSKITTERRSQILTELTPEERVRIDERITNGICHLTKEWVGSTPSIERPIRFYMCGNDDCSYTAVFASESEALAALADIEQNPIFDLIHDKYGFVFTN